MILYILVKWRSMNTQGPDYDPYIDNDQLFFDRPVLLSEIKDIVKKQYGPLIDGIEIVAQEGEK